MSQRKPAAMTARKKTPPAVMIPAKKTNPYNLTTAQRASLAEEFLRPARERKALYNAPEFKTLMQTFRDVVAREEVIDQEAVKYAKKGRYPFTADEFQKAFEAVMENAPGDEQVRRTESGNFPVIYKNYEGLEFSVLIGQGSVYFVSAEEKTGPKP